VRDEAGTGVCDCRSTLGRVDDGAEGATPGLLATGALGPQTLVPFLILKLILAVGVCALLVDTQQGAMQQQAVAAPPFAGTDVVVLAVSV
jgi:hypothetical protein